MFSDFRNFTAKIISYFVSYFGSSRRYSCESFLIFEDNDGK